MLPDHVEPEDDETISLSKHLEDRAFYDTWDGNDLEIIRQIPKEWRSFFNSTWTPEGMEALMRAEQGLCVSPDCRATPVAKALLIVNGEPRCAPVCARHKEVLAPRYAIMPLDWEPS